jgi:DNA-binding GntR family transcriptional regulator
MRSEGPKQPVRPSLVREAYEGLKGRILNNELMAGRQYLEPELVLQLGMSRTPVREALIRLESEGLVRIVPRRGILVVPISSDDMVEIYEIVTALEAAAAERLAGLMPDESLIAPLRAAVEEMDSALARDDLDAWGKADEDFHRAIVVQSGNARLSEMALRVRDQIVRARLATMRLRYDLTRSNEAHRALVAAIESGNAALAGDLHRTQRKRATTELLALLKLYRFPHL